MKVKITVTGPSGQQVQRNADVQKEGDLTSAIGDVIGDYRRTYPEAPPFEKNVKVEHA